jgi:hypothetical protein
MAKRRFTTRYAVKYAAKNPVIAALSVELGSYILGQTPYPDPKYPNPGQAFRAETYGPGVEYSTEHPYESPDVRSKKATFKGKLLTDAKRKTILRKGLFWKIGGRNLRMSKVIRIPYTYTYYEEGVKKTGETALVIGYEGAGGGC